MLAHKQKHIKIFIWVIVGGGDDHASSVLLIDRSDCAMAGALGGPRLAKQALLHRLVMTRPREPETAERVWRKAKTRLELPWEVGSLPEST